MADGIRGERLLIGETGAEFVLPSGERISIRSRKSLSKLLRALAIAHVERPGEPLSRAQLIEAAWPGEVILPDAARNRLGVALATLRKLGLGEYLERVGEAYRLREAVAVELFADDD